MSDSGNVRQKPAPLHVSALLAATILGACADNLQAQRPNAAQVADSYFPFFLVDLSGHVNFTFHEPQLKDPGNNLASLVAGSRKGPVLVKVLQKVPFRLDGVVLVGPEYTGSEENGMVSLPGKVDGVPVGKDAERLFFLHAAHFGEGGFGQIGAYVVHYADGSHVEIPIRLGRDVMDWWGRDDPDAPIPMANIVWRGYNAAVRSHGYSHIRLFMTNWKNPHPDKVLASIDMIVDGQSPGLRSPAPFLVGLTGKVDEEFYPHPKQKGPPVLRKRP